MSNTAKWVLGILASLFVLGCFFMLFIVSVFLFGTEDDDTISTSGERVAVVELNEPILSSQEIVRQFKKYRENSSIKAIVFRVESPGGGVSASQEIYEEVKKTRDGGKPVVVSMGSVAASGGYYVACGASKIIANPGTLTGSIGVIFQFLHFNELMNKVGIDASTIKTGKFKDTGSPFRKTTEEEKKYLDLVLADVYDQFVSTVVTERKLTRKHVEQYADGRIFTGRQALEYGFVDSLGTMEDAVGLAAKLGHISGKPKVVKEYKRKTFLERMLGETASDIAGLRNELFHQPVLQYKFSSSY
ncbi:MAG: signal peptide peptidase SppA [Ignavibacteriales bacterium]|nr:signal peptide peptidase SppA [Ignavibacteriales bacterium]